MDERLGKIRVRRQDLEARLADLEAATRDALAFLARFRAVLEEGTLEQRKEFQRGFVAEVAIDLDASRGAIAFYELPVTSLMMAPVARVALLKKMVSRNMDRFALNDGAWRVAA